MKLRAHVSFGSNHPQFANLLLTGRFAKCAAPPVSGAYYREMEANVVAVKVKPGELYTALRKRGFEPGNRPGLSEVPMPLPHLLPTIFANQPGCC